MLRNVSSNRTELKALLGDPRLIETNRTQENSCQKTDTIGDPPVRIYDPAAERCFVTNRGFYLHNIWTVVLMLWFVCDLNLFFPLNRERFYFFGLGFRFESVCS